MNLRMNIFGKGQGLDGDKTSTGATCIANQAQASTKGVAGCSKATRPPPALAAVKKERSSTANHVGARMAYPPK
jgi:hypothetical protein